MSILASLARAYDRLASSGDVPLQGYSTEKIGFVISLNPDGSVASVTDLREGEGKKKSPRMMQVPQPIKRTVAVAPNLLWDKTAYVLGVTAGPGHRAADEHAKFKERHLKLIVGIDDAGLLALKRFLENWSPDLFAPPSWPDEMKDQNVIFAFEPDRRICYLHDRPAAKALVSAGSSESGKGDGQICLIDGTKGAVAALHPSIKGVWGAQSSGASIVAFNQRSFESYGHEQGDNAPISEFATFKYSTALNTFLAGKTNRLQVGDASMVFWADASDVDAARVTESVFRSWFGEVDESVEAVRVGAILKRIRDGVVWREAVSNISPALSDGVRFHVLGLAPNAARISIRFWFEDDFGVMARNYQRFVADMSVDPPPRDPYPPLWRYLAETAVLGKRDNVQPNLAGEWMRAILAGTRYPMTLLSAVLTRIRADGEVNGLRAGMLRALVVRNFHLEKEAPVSLDPANRNKGYLLGRLFAAYEQAQSAALGRNVNATIKDKFYGSASATPRNVFALLEKGSANHLSKLGKLRPGQRVNLERTIGGIFEAMDPADNPFPASLTAEDQALFGLGYYHQRSEFFRKPEAAAEEGAAV